MRAFEDMPKQQEEALKDATRQKCLDDLQYLAKHVLNYNRVTDHIHRQMAQDIDTPRYKFRLLLWPRGHFKSTLGTEARSIQKLLRNPNERILITNAKLENSRKFVRTIVHHFNAGPKFRWAWRDWWLDQYATSYHRAAMGKKLDWVTRDTQDEFTVLRPYEGREASLTTGATDASLVSQHYCLFAGSKVLTSKGLVPVEEIRRGHRVLTKEGVFKSVEAVGRQKTHGVKVKVKPSYTSETTELTYNHRVLVHRDEGLRWVDAGCLTEEDKLVIPKMRGKSGSPSKTNDRLNRLYRTPDIWRLLGYWVGDGCRTPDGAQIRIVQGTHEPKNVEDIVDIVENHLGCNVTVRETDSSTYMICFSDEDFKELTKSFGDYAYNKKLPVWVLSNYNSKQIEFLKGYFRADGCLSGNSVSFSSTSLDLLTGIQLLLAQFDIPAGICKGTNGGEMQILDYASNTIEDWALRSTHPMLKLLLEEEPGKFPTKPFKSFFTDEHWVTGIDKIEKEEFENEIVYDIQVAGDESFYCPGMIVHNSTIIADDLVNRDYVRTQEMVEKSILYFKDLLDLLDPDGELEIIGTRWSHMDLYQWIIEEFGHKASMRVPEHFAERQSMKETIQASRETPEEEKDWMVSIYPCYNEQGKPIFPEEFTSQVLADLEKAKGPYEFGSQYLLDPTPEEHQKFKAEWINRLDIMPDPSELTGCITVDPAISKEDEACRMALTVCGYDRENRMYFLDGLNERISEEQFAEAVFQYVVYWKNKFRHFLPVGFESIGFQQVYVYNMRRMMMERNEFFAIEEIKRRNQSKDERILRLVPRIRNEFYAPKKLMKTPWEGKGEPYDLINRLIWELTKFPYAGYKDLADALADQLDIVKANKIPVRKGGESEDTKVREFTHPSIVEDKKKSRRSRVSKDFDAVR